MGENVSECMYSIRVYTFLGHFYCVCVCVCFRYRRFDKKKKKRYASKRGKTDHGEIKRSFFAIYPRLNSYKTRILSRKKKEQVCRKKRKDLDLKYLKK